MKLSMKQTQPSTEFDAFIAAHPYGHYMKTTMWAKEMEYEGNHPRFFVFTDENNHMVGTAMAVYKKWLGQPYLYIPWGPCIDYEDPDTVTQVFTLLKNYGASQHVIFLRTDPNVLRKCHDIKGNDIEGPNHEYVTEILKSLGYHHKGYGYAYNASWTNRYTLIVDLHDDMDTVESRFTKVRQRSLRKSRKLGLETRIGGKEDIPLICELEKQLFAIKANKPHTPEFFENILDSLGEHAAVYVTSCNLKYAIEVLEKELNTKQMQKDASAHDRQVKEIEHLRSLMNQYGEKVDVAAGLFARLGDKSWDLYIYNHKAFGFLKVTDPLHRFVMEDMKNHGVLQYDMVGFSGCTDKKDYNYGLYNYKSSFAPEFIERIGQFDYVYNEGAWKRFNWGRLNVNRVKRRWYILRYKRNERED
jgi:lipid II:glycine glycyltransferase (peptidoglycan interpeptide bridge formation enzyme)